jgi:hypothetical protein
MRDVVKLLLRPVSVLSLGLSTMGMMVRGGVVNAGRAAGARDGRESVRQSRCAAF